MSLPEHKHLFVGRVRRAPSVEGMPPIISLDLMRDDDVAEIDEGDEFVTVLLAIDPFAPKE